MITNVFAPDLIFLKCYYHHLCRSSRNKKLESVNNEDRESWSFISGSCWRFWSHQSAWGPSLFTCLCDTFELQSNPSSHQVDHSQSQTCSSWSGAWMFACSNTSQPDQPQGFIDVSNTHFPFSHPGETHCFLLFLLLSSFSFSGGPEVTLFSWCCWTEGENLDPTFRLCLLSADLKQSHSINPAPPPFHLCLRTWRWTLFSPTLSSWWWWRWWFASLLRLFLFHS